MGDEARRIKERGMGDNEVTEEAVARFECQRDRVWFDLKLWNRREILICKESDISKIITRHFKRVDGKPDPRVFDEKGRLVVKEEVDRDIPPPRIIKKTKAQIMGQLDALNIMYDSSLTLVQLINLLPEDQK